MQTFSNKKVSAIVAVMNRTKILKLSIHSWLQNKDISEIIIVDWSSEPPIPNLADLDKRIKIIRVDNKRNFQMTKAYNLALSNARGDMIIKLDADYILNPYFNIFDYLKLEEGEFITGFHKHLSIDNGTGFLQYLNGFIYTHKETLNKVGGWNESIKNYGFDDCECYQRLERSGMKRVILDIDKNNIPIYHNPHPDTSRFKHFPSQECWIERNRAKYGVLNKYNE
jgi:glycosyltransferase involved in cell wall biosynthesis